MREFCFIEWYKPTKDDALVWFQILSCLFGIGSLSMAHSFSQAGPYYGTFIFLLSCLFNIYPSVLLSRCFLEVPEEIITFCDLGEYCFGLKGKKIIQIMQWLTCLMLAMVFLILGGTMLLPTIFGTIFPNISYTYWILIMSITLLPGILAKSFKESLYIMIFGVFTSLFADIIAVSDSLLNLPWRSIESKPIEMGNVMSVFGSLALSYGIGIVIPSFQREHREPRHMPMNIVISLSFVTILYLLIAFLGYWQYGCSSETNLLSTIQNHICKIIAFTFMQFHLMIATTILLNPLFFYFERLMFRLPVGNDLDKNYHAHRDYCNSLQLVSTDNNTTNNNNNNHSIFSSNDINNQIRCLFIHNDPNHKPYDIMSSITKSKNMDSLTELYSISKESTGMIDPLQIEISKNNIYNMTTTVSNNNSKYMYPSFHTEDIRPSSSNDKDHYDIIKYTCTQQIRSYIFRIFIIFFLTFIAILCQSSFSDFVGFVGATSITWTCIIIPCILYYKMFHPKLFLYEKLFCTFVILSCLFLGIYTSYIKMKNIIENVSTYHLFGDNTYAKEMIYSVSKITQNNTLDPKKFPCCNIK